MKSRGVKTTLIGLSAFSLLAPTSAYAYIDPVSGSAILQMLAAAGLAAGFMVKRFWASISAAARRFWDRVSD